MLFSVRNWLSAVALVILLGGSPVVAQNNPGTAQPLFTYTGDGLSLVVLTYSEDEGTLTGQVRQGASVYPFTAKTDDSGDIKGSFIVNGNSFPFQSRENEDDTVTFSTGSKTYKLKPVVPELPKPPVTPSEPLHEVPPPSPAEPNNPLNPVNPPITPPAPPPASSDPGNPLNAPVTPVPIPAPDNPLNVPANPAPGRANTAAMPEVMKLKRVEFRDVNMGGVVAYTMIIPQSWKADGRIEWSVGNTPYPQPHIQISSPEGGQLNLVPFLSFMYTEANPIPGFAPLPPSGMPVPADIAQWYLTNILSKQRTDAVNIRLVSDKRDTKMEETMRRMSREMGVNDQGNDERIHVMIFSYDKAGVAYREEVRIMYTIMPPYSNQNIRSESWSLMTNLILAAPEQQFDKLYPQFLAAYNTYLATPKWFTQSQLMLMELAQNRIRDFANAMREAAARYDQISQQQQATFNQKMASGEKDQTTRINSVYEVDDYRDVDGSLVKLSFHYKHTYSDGKGNIVQTNDSLQRPGSEYTEIGPHKFK